MSRAAVICEFNPFHNGHKFLLEKIKSEYADEIICIMSGSFVQRGDIAITDKYSRTEAALINGADMVVELPTVYASAPAQIFASNGVRLADELSCDMLCFGAENDIFELENALSVIDSPDTQNNIAAAIKAGKSYPSAITEALGDEVAKIVKKPNNILALEYIRSCRRYGITPIAIPREGVEHDAVDPSGRFASGSTIRSMIANGSDCSEYTPMQIVSPALLNSLEAVILYKLKTIDKDELALLPDVSEGLENRIYDTAINYNSLTEILEQIKTKRYTLARLRRIMIYILLDVTRHLQLKPVPYVRVLGFRQEKQYMLGAKTLPLIVDVRRGYDLLHQEAKQIFDIDIKASQAMNIACGTTHNEFSYGVIRI